VRQFEPDVYHILALLMAESEDKRWAMRDTEVARHKADMHNARFGNKVRGILDRRKTLIRRLWRMRARCLEARDTVQRMLGYDILERWPEENLESRIRSAQAGISERDVQSLDAYVSRLRETVDSIKSRMSPGPLNNR
jgi:hypothetical protein